MPDNRALGIRNIELVLTRLCVCGPGVVVGEELKQKGYTPGRLQTSRQQHGT